MAQLISFEPDDAGRIRFAISPLWELMAAVRTLIDDRRHRWHRPWLAETEAARAVLDLAPLAALSPRRGYTPDFLFPGSTGPVARIDDELAAVAATPLRRVEREVSRSLTERDRPADPAVAARLATPATARDLLVESLERAWDSLLAPFWPRLVDVLQADIAHRTRRIGDDGLYALLAGLHPAVRWTGSGLQVDARFEERHRLDGVGLVLMPSAFAWPEAVAVVEPPVHPTVVYPARGIAELWHPRPASPGPALVALLGRTRATLLDTLGEPTSTTALARTLNLSTSTVSDHLLVLEGAGLLTRRRRGRSVLYVRTAVGDQLC